MATHFICQSTEPLPHVYPTGLPTKTHGAVSQYEVYNSSDKPHTRFPPPGWDFSQTSEEDSLPLIHPVPQPSTNISCSFDPDLCITPQKSKAVPTHIEEHPSKSAFFQADLDLTLTPQRVINANLNNNVGDKRVRFDLDETESDLSINKSNTTKHDRPYQPELYGDDDDDFFETKDNKTDSARTVKYTVKKLNDQQAYVPITDRDSNSPIESDTKIIPPKQQIVKSKPVPTSKKQLAKSVKVVRESKDSKGQTSIKSVTGNKNATGETADPIAQCKVPETSNVRRKAKVCRENQHYLVETEYSYPFEQDVKDYAGGEEHMFARPEYNSTLRMKLEAEKLKESEVDIEVALKKKLRISCAVKSDINEKAASHVNTEGAAFSGLVNLDVPVDELCKHAVEVKTARAKQVKMPKSKLKTHKEPDVMEFFSPEFQKESVSYSLPCVPAPSEQLSTAANIRAFDLYKHNRMWNS